MCLNCDRSALCRFALSLSILFVLIAWFFFCCVCVGVVWQVSKSGSGFAGPGFDASPYRIPLLGSRLFSSTHALVRRVNGLIFILVD